MDNLISLAQALNDIIIIGEDQWRLILLSIVSTYAPRLKMNGLDIRNNLHVLFPGDVSTAKSQIINVIKKIAPKWESISKATEPSLEGASISNTEMRAGLLETASDGMLLIPEFQSAYFSHIQVLREALDGSEVRVVKRAQMRAFTPNITLVGACNPSDDFFNDEYPMRKQIGYKEGLMTRFDIVIPLLASPDLNERVIEKMSLFEATPAGVDWKRMAECLDRIQTRLKPIKQITITQSQAAVLKRAFLLHNRRTLRGRPFVLLRDMETLCRLTNAITAFFSTFIPPEMNTLTVKDEHIDLAVSLWESILAMREQFYNNMTRQMDSLDDLILKEIENQGGLAFVTEVKEAICEQKKLCGTTTFYKRLSELTAQGMLMRKKGPAASVAIITNASTGVD